MRVRGIVILIACGLAVTLLAASAADGPAPRTVVINEVELNPNGLDRDAEWVEVLNVGSTPVDVAGWSLTYDYPVDGADVIAAESLVLRPGQRFVFRYEGLRLRNDANTVVRLLDAAGTVIDETPALYDVDDDGKTWQRIPDGGDPLFPMWLQRGATRNAPNV